MIIKILKAVNLLYKTAINRDCYLLSISDIYLVLYRLVLYFLLFNFSAKCTSFPLPPTFQTQDQPLSCALYNYLHRSKLVFSFAVIITCPNLTDPTNGILTCSFGGDGVADPGETCTLICDTGYMPNGSANRTCQSNGIWTGTDATCNRGNLFVHYTLHIN